MKFVKLKYFMIKFVFQIKTEFERRSEECEEFERRKKPGIRMLFFKLILYVHSGANIMIKFFFLIFLLINHTESGERSN